MRKRALRVLPNLLLSLSLCGIALSAKAQEAPPRPVQLEDSAPLTSRDDLSSILAYQSVTDPDASYEPGGLTTRHAERTRSWPNRPLMLTSGTVFVLSYIPAVLTAAVDKQTTSNNLYIPIAGPWMEIARDSPSGGNKALLSLSGIFQSLGTIGLVSSFFIPERRTKNWYLMGNRLFKITPTASRAGYGLSASGQF
jgi:hypothetical protein